MTEPLSAIFGFLGFFYGLLLPLMVLQIIALLFIPSMLNTGAKPREVGEALFCYLMQGVGVILMTVGALPTVFSVFAGVAFPGRTYVALLVVFTCGGILFLIHDQLSQSLSSASKAVPQAVYFFSLKIIGNLIALLSGLSIILSIITGNTQQGWWVMPFVLLFYGLILSWCTRVDQEKQVFQSAPMQVPTRITAKKPAARSKPKKTAKKKR